MKGVLLNEIAKWISSPKRWLPILLAAFILGWANTSQISAAALNEQVGVNIWDAYFLSLNNTIDLYLVLLLSIAFSVCDVVTNDYLTNYHWLVLTRSLSRFKWWLAKLTMVFLTALSALTATFFSTFFWGYSVEYRFRLPQASLLWETLRGFSISHRCLLILLFSLLSLA